MVKRIKNLAKSALAHQGFMRYFANTSWIFGEMMLRMISGLLVGIWVARYLGPAQFGLFNYALAYVAIFSGLAKLGLDSIVVRDLVSHPQKRDLYLGTAFWLKVVGAFVMLGIVAIASLFSSNDHTTNLYIFIIASGIIFQSSEVVDFYFQSQVLSRVVSISRIVQLLLSSVLKIYFVLTGADLIWFVVVTLVDQLTLSLSLYLSYRYQKLGSFIHYFDLKLASQLLKISWPLILSGLATTIYMRIDQLMIKEMLGDKELGFFSAAVKLSEVWYVIPSIIASSIFPSIVNAKKISREFYLQRLQKLTTLMTWIALAVALPVTFFADSIINLLYGDRYHSASLVLAIHIWGTIFVFIGIASGVFFTIENYTKKSLYCTLLGASSNVLLNLALIPLYGIAGAAVATVISQCIANFLYDFFDTSLKELVAIKLNSLFPIYYFKLIKNY